MLWGSFFSSLERMLLTRERSGVGEVDGVVVAIEPRWTVARAGQVLAGGDDSAGPLDHAAEVGRVERSAEHSLVHLAQLGEREHLAEEGVGDAGVLHLGAEPPERVFDD